jgi:hypothetical protein
MDIGDVGSFVLQNTNSGFFDDGLGQEPDINIQTDIAEPQVLNIDSVDNFASGVSFENSGDDPYAQDPFANAKDPFAGGDNNSVVSNDSEPYQQVQKKPTIKPVSRGPPPRASAPSNSHAPSSSHAPSRPPMATRQNTQSSNYSQRAPQEPPRRSSNLGLDDDFNMLMNPDKKVKEPVVDEPDVGFKESPDDDYQGSGGYSGSGGDYSGSGGDYSGSNDYSGGYGDSYAPREPERPREPEKPQKKKFENADQEKLYYLKHFREMEREGYDFGEEKFSMRNSLDELKMEYLVRTEHASKKSSIRRYKSMIMTGVTGLEMLNKRFNPVGLDMDGFSTHLYQNDLESFDEPLRKIQEKYKDTEDYMSPEVELISTFFMCAFEFYMAKRLADTLGPNLAKAISSDKNLMGGLMNASMRASDQQQQGYQGQQVPGQYGQTPGQLNPMQAGHQMPAMTGPSQDLGSILSGLNLGSLFQGLGSNNLSSLSGSPVPQAQTNTEYNPNPNVRSGELPPNAYGNFLKPPESDRRHEDPMEMMPTDNTGGARFRNSGTAGDDDASIASENSEIRTISIGKMKPTKKKPTNKKVLNI